MQVATGRSILNGIAIGPLRIYQKKETQTAQTSTLTPAEELERFESARLAAQKQLGGLYDKALEEVGAGVAGYYAAASVRQLADREGVEMPICRCAYEVLYQGKQARDVVPELMGRAGKDELLGTAWL